MNRRQENNKLNDKISHRKHNMHGPFVFDTFDILTSEAIDHLHRI